MEERRGRFKHWQKRREWMQLQRQHIHFFFFFFFSFWAFKVCSHISLITFKMHQWEGGVMIELPWLEIKRRSGVDGLRLGGRKGIWLLNDHVKQSPPAPPFLHPISPPPPLPPPPAPRSTLPPTRGYTLTCSHITLTHRWDTGITRRTRVSRREQDTREPAGQLHSSQWGSVKYMLIAKSREGAGGGGEGEQEEGEEKQRQGNSCCSEVCPSLPVPGHVAASASGPSVNFHAHMIWMMPTMGLANGLNRGLHFRAWIMWIFTSRWVSFTGVITVL